MDETSAESAAVTLPKWRIVRQLVIIAAAGIFFCVVPPTAVPLIMLPIGFMVLALSLYGLVKIILILTGLQAKLRPLHRRAIVLLAVCLPVLLIMLQSLGQLTLRDSLTLGGLFSVGVFYVLRLK